MRKAKDGRPYLARDGGRGLSGRLRRALRRTVPAALTAWLLGGCGDSTDWAGAQPHDPSPGEAAAPGAGPDSLAVLLEEMEDELGGALAGEPGRLLAAEAISDRLLAANRPVDWLPGGYDVEARLRQLQAMADRLVAMRRRGASADDVEDDVAGMRRMAADLRAQLGAMGGGPAPPTLESLLSQDPLRDVQAASLRAVMTARDSAAADHELQDIEPRIGPVQSRELPGRLLRVPPDTTGRPR